MGDFNEKSALGRLLIYLGINSKEINSIISRDEKKPEEDGLTQTFFEAESTRGLVSKLMDTRSFKDASKNERKKLIYSDYFPEESKTLQSVYLEDKRHLCQEFHNRLAVHLGLSPTAVCFSDFKGLDEDLCYTFDPLSGHIFINDNFQDNEDDIMQLLVYTTQATYLYELQHKVNNLYKNYDNYSKEERYICLSHLLAQTSLSELSKLGANDERKGLALSNDYSVTDIYANLKAYDTIERIANDYGLKVISEVEDYLSEKEDFLLSLSGEGEEVKVEDDILDEIEEDDEDYAYDAILNTTLTRDFTMLETLQTSLINIQTNNDVFSIFIDLLETNADDFYEGLNFPLDASYSSQYRDFIESEQAERLDAERDYDESIAINEDAEEFDS